MQSRRNNPAQGLVGALYFGDGCFFQCLEGPAHAVDALYARLHHDPRHRDLVVLSRSDVDRPSYAGWSMKFVPNAVAVRAVLDRHGLASFDPYHFAPGAIDDMVALLVDGPEGALAGTTPGRPMPIVRTPVDPTLATARQARLLAWAALATSLVSFVVALAR
jgi:hypothetical protein